MNRAFVLAVLSTALLACGSNSSVDAPTAGASAQVDFLLTPSGTAAPNLGANASTYPLRRELVLTARDNAGMERVVTGVQLTSTAAGAAMSFDLPSSGRIPAHGALAMVLTAFYTQALQGSEQTLTLVVTMTDASGRTESFTARDVLRLKL